MAELLLRLFQSDFFSPALGISYLRIYADSIGITWHLIHLLRTRYSAQDLAFYWPQLCHLLLTSSNSDSLALETYILDIAAADPHTALITSWIFQAALRDLSSQPNTPSFRVCQRILNHCHHILFHTPDLDHFLLASATETLQAAQLQQSRLKREQLEREHHNRLLQQLGASSSDSDVALSLPISKQQTQGKQSSSAAAAPTESLASDLSTSSRPVTPRASSVEKHLPNENSPSQPYLRSAISSFLTQQLPSSLLPALLRRSARPKVLPSNALTTLVGAGAILASTPGQPALAKEAAMVAVLQGMKAHDRNQVPTRLTDQGDEVFDEFEVIDPNLGPDGRLPLFGIQRPVPQRTVPLSAQPPQPPPTSLGAMSPRHQFRSAHAPASASASSIFLPGSASPASSMFHHSSSSSNKVGSSNRGIIVSQLPKAYLSSLLRTHYFRAQTRMLQQLQDISTRLLAHPKAERLAALRTELTQLNHTLPNEVCLPLWCECGPDASTTSAIARAELNANAAIAAAEAAEAAATAAAEADAAGTGVDGHIYDESRFRLLASESIASANKAVKSTTNGAGGSALLSEAKTPKAAVRHHRIVRIDPAEAVVLNSADRAPYLLHVEVLRDDLDFDPDRRGNRELCERLVRGEAQGRARREEQQRRWSASGGASSSNVALPGRTSISAQGSPLLVASTASPTGPSSTGQNTGRSRQASSTSTVSTASSALVPDSSVGGGSISRSGSIRAAKGRIASGSAADEKALPSLPPPQMDPSADASSITGSTAAGEGSKSNRNGPIAGSSTNPASGINPMSEVGPGPSPAMADPEGPLETMFADLAVGDVGARGNEEALVAAAASLAAAAASGGDKHPHHGPALSSSSAGIGGDSEAADGGEDGDAGGGEKAKKSMGAEDLETVMRAVNKDDPSAAIFRESWSAKKARIRASSPYGHLPEWDVFSMIVKTGADLRQEQLAVQLIDEFGRIWASTGCPCWVRYFRILVTGEESGLMETITDSVSVHSIKKEAYSRRLAQQGVVNGPGGGGGGASAVATGAEAGGSATPSVATTSSVSASVPATSGTGAPSATAAVGASSSAPVAATSSGRMQTYSLFEHFQETFGDVDSPSYLKAQNNFIQAMAGYSIICYLLQIKDRHNGNILIDHQGHIIHIDFGFMLGISPGGVGFEAAPFKFPQEYIDILGGMGSEAYERFKALMRQGFRDVRKNAERIIMIVELMQKDSKLPCFALNEQCAAQLRDRFQLGLSQTQCDEFVDRLVLTSAGSVYTRLYDRYQSFTQGIL
ncbi:Phosphatidylinositol 4-kinase pik1alpha (PI4-kinase)(PtdIns-4-kinase) [Tilletia horrida]|nr:Phosphatidylinositol 4-kinase pik1alpha (PI4-kinase)(PtdIns-4-kinase) [Tilletia horrida]